MNEQINKLFGQALDEAVPETWTTLDADQLSRLKEKFAELIVRECAGIIESQDVDPAFRHRMTWAMKQHFGVKND
jgi:hypothetical protein